MNRKFGKFAKIIVVFIAVVIISAIIFNKLINTKYESLNDMDRKILNQLSEVYKIYNNNSKEIWKEDYNVNDIPIVLTPAKKENGMFHLYSYVIGVDKFKSSIFSKEIEVPEEMNLPPIYKVSFLSPTLLKQWLPINFIFSDIDDEHVAFFKYNPVNTESEDTEEAFKYFFMHEVFHEYRQVPIWKDINSLISSIYTVERNKEQYQLLITELAILDKAEKAGTKDELRNILNDFVTIRDFRYDKFTYMEQEKKVETLEGTAQYIEYKYSSLVQDKVKPPITVNGNKYNFLDVFNEKTLNAFVNLNGFIDKDLYYYTGAIQETYLDKLEVEWKNRVENNELIYDILKEEVKKNWVNSEKSVDDIKNEYGYNNFEDEAEIIVNILKENS